MRFDSWDLDGRRKDDRYTRGLIGDVLTGDDNAVDEWWHAENDLSAVAAAAHGLHLDEQEFEARAED